MSTAADEFAARFGMALEDARRIVEAVLERGAQVGELFLEESLATTLVMEDGRIRNVATQVDAGGGIRGIHGDTQAYGFAQTFDPEALTRTASQVAAVANLGPSTHLGAVVSVAAPRVLYRGDKPSVHVPPADKVDLLRRADAAARAHSPKVKRVDVSLSEELRILGLVHSGGSVTVDLQPMISMRVSVVAEDKGLRQQGMVGGGGRFGLEYFDGKPPESLGREAARMAVDMLEARPAPAGEQVVILAPGDSGVLLHEAVGHGLEGDFNRKGTSKYSGKVGEAVASPLCTVVDDGTLPGSRGSIHVDDEGNLATKNVLIENGVLRGYMHDSLSAKHFSVPTTGNGRRQSYRMPPFPRMTNTYLAAGEQSPEEILAGTRKGIYCKTFSGGQVNISNGDFVFQVVESYLIEDGRLTAPLKDVVIIGNGPEALKRVVAVGTDLQFSDGRWTCGKEGQSIPVGVGTPTVKIEGITVGGTE